MDGLSIDSLSGCAGGPSAWLADDTESDGDSILSRWKGGRLRAPWSAFAAANDGQLDAFSTDALSTDSSIWSRGTGSATSGASPAVRAYACACKPGDASDLALVLPLPLGGVDAVPTASPFPLPRPRAGREGDELISDVSEDGASNAHGPGC